MIFLATVLNNNQCDLLRDQCLFMYIHRNSHHQPIYLIFCQTLIELITPQKALPIIPKLKSYGRSAVFLSKYFFGMGFSCLDFILQINQIHAILFACYTIC